MLQLDDTSYHMPIPDAPVKVPQTHCEILIWHKKMEQYIFPQHMYVGSCIHKGSAQNWASWVWVFKVFKINKSCVEYYYKGHKQYILLIKLLNDGQTCLNV